MSHAASQNQQDTAELYQFRYAMYPEKARWALDLCGIPYRSHAVLPGTHPPTMLRLAGQKCTPVLKTSNRLLKSSTDILEWANTESPAQKLYGHTPEQTQQIKTLVAEFDAIGVHTRRAYFYELLQCGGYAADLFSTGYSDRTRAIYKATFAITKTVMRLDMAINKSSAAESRKITKEALNSIVQKTQQGRYLVGDSFSAADLTAATVLGVCVLPDEYPVTVPQPYPQPLQHWLDRWAEHPATTWVKNIYRDHRPANQAIGGL